jgi:hypothetical protein
MFILKLLLVYPLVAATAWTMLTALFTWFAPMGRKLPNVLWCHPMMLMLNYHNPNLTARPEVLRVVVFLLLGIMPVVSLAMVAWMVWSLVGPAIVDARLRKRDPARHKQLLKLDSRNYTP